MITTCSSELENYSVTELGLLGLGVNISQYKQLLAKPDFDCTVDH